MDERDLFKVYSICEVGGELHLVGKILIGHFTNQYFFASYSEISQEKYITQSRFNNEGDIAFSDGGKYYMIRVGLHKDMELLFIVDEIKSALVDISYSKWIYSRYMSTVAYIILTGMLVTRV